MNSYPQILSAMMEDILTGETNEAYRVFCEKENFSAANQVAVYADAYRIRLHDVLKATYPALLNFLGGETFHKLAEKYIAEHPSRHFNLDRYPVAFSASLIHSEAGIVCDIARLESEIARVYMAEESEAIAPGWIAGQTEESFSQSYLKPRTASALLALSYEVNDYANALRAGEKPAPPLAEQNWLLIYRHNHQLQRMPLSEGEYVLLSLLDGKTPLSNALESEQFSPFSEKLLHGGEFMQWFARWTQKGCLCLST